MVCTSCGAQIDSPGKFCAKCGAQLPEAAPVPPSNDFAAVPPPPPEAPAAAPAARPPAPPVAAPAAPAWAQTPPPPPPVAPPAWSQAPAQPVAPPPQYGAPQYGAPPYGAPQYGAPQYATAAGVAGTGMLAALLALAGGAAAVGSAWLAWAASGTGDAYFKPIDVTSDTGDLANGYYLIAAGAVAAACGLILLLGLVKTASSRMLVSLGAVAGGAVVVAVEFVAYNHVNDLITMMGSSSVSIGIGLYVGAAGGVVAAVGGLLGLTSKR